MQNDIGRPQKTQRDNQPGDIFRPPEVVAEQEQNQDQPIEHIDMNPQQSDRPKKQRRSFKEWLKSLSKKQWIIIGIVAVLLLGGGGYGVYALVFNKKTPVKTVVIKKKPAVIKPATIASSLTGLQVDPALNQRPTTAVMIENSTFARPQSGLDKAGVVFEAVAEGGITRFEAIFQDTTPTYVGPVRSVRPYYIQWALGFDAAIAHVGGSPEALTDMKTWNAKDLDQFYNAPSYQRIATRDAPHNVYTGIDQLNALEAKKGFGAPKFTGFARKVAKPAKAPTASSIDIAISSADYNSHYDYDPATNAYKRSEGGQPHMEMDQNGAQTQITADTVIALTMPQGIEPDDKHTSYGTIGTGHATIFQDGTATDGTWHKASNNENLTFTDAAGKVITLNPGRTWITVVGNATFVTFH
ncbi:MAG TPA: DUF3048 domain-containing protein [Patescibacteria group bacterium]|nr:DUF3048 domain-containing protein [Patescibacteria group bacterium]